MKRLSAILAIVLSLVLGGAAVGQAAGRGGHGGGSHGGGGVHGGGFHGGHGGGFHGHPGAFHGHPHFRGRGFIGVAPFYWGPGYVYPPVVEAPPVYTQPTTGGYWYYCQSAGAYYPTVPSCPEPWVPVPAS